VKTYCTFLLTALFLFPKWTAALALEPMQPVQCSASGIHIQLVLPNAYKPPRVGVPGRREGAGTR